MLSIKSVISRNMRESALDEHFCLVEAISAEFLYWQFLTILWFVFPIITALVGQDALSVEKVAKLSAQPSSKSAV